jgi:hypothetical protein
MRLPATFVVVLAVASASAQTAPGQLPPKESEIKRIKKDVAVAIDPDAATTVPIATKPYVPVSGQDRMAWFIKSTIGIDSLLLAGPISAGWGTWRRSPEESPPTWEGFGQRYGMRLTGVSTGNAITATTGAIWGEDPRYFRLENAPFKQHVYQVLKLSIMSRYRDGEYRFGYAKLAGNVGNNFLSNTWRVPSESTAGQASLRCVYGLLGRMAGNAFTEFWPLVKERVFKK